MRILQGVEQHNHRPASTKQTKIKNQKKKTKINPKNVIKIGKIKKNVYPVAE